MIERTVFVPSGDSQRDTAVLLVGTAKEHGVDQRSILSTVGGFWITQNLSDLVFGEAEAAPEPEPEPEPKTTRKRASSKKTSGNRAAKTSTPEKE